MLLNVAQLKIQILMMISSLVLIAGFIGGIFGGNFKVSYIVFNLVFNVSVGMNKIFCMQCLWEYYPKRRGLVTGLLLACYKLGSVLEFLWFN